MEKEVEHLPEGEVKESHDGSILGWLILFGIIILGHFLTT
jgi:hypothetical protein